jgi:hypothetical protein
MVTFTIHIPQMLAYIPYMDPMGTAVDCEHVVWTAVFMAMATFAGFLTFHPYIFCTPQAIDPQKVKITTRDLGFHGPVVKGIRGTPCERTIFSRAGSGMQCMQCRGKTKNKVSLCHPQSGFQNQHIGWSNNSSTKMWRCHHKKLFVEY